MKETAPFWSEDTRKTVSRLRHGSCGLKARSVMLNPVVNDEIWIEIGERADIELNVHAFEGGELIYVTKLNVDNVEGETKLIETKHFARFSELTAYINYLAETL